MPKIIKKYATCDEVPMSIEELLEALPVFIHPKRDEVYCLIIDKSESCWIIGYEELYMHKDTLRKALEGVYNDLKSNKLI